jgi:[ribosomal protein S5]-alanine N-acetyltransferase
VLRASSPEVEAWRYCGGVIITPLLRLVPATVELLEAELRDHAEAAAMLGARPVPDWPPQYNGPKTFAWALERLLADPAWAGWGTHYVLFEGAVVGTGGYKGPPTDEGSVEVGYSIVPSYQRRGLATEMAQGLVDTAFARGVRRVVAHTLAPPEGDASIGVLRKVGFTGAPSTEEGAVGHAIERPA